MCGERRFNKNNLATQSADSVTYGEPIRDNRDGWRL